jgi:Xaa-Pro aminopeptidase
MDAVRAIKSSGEIERHRLAAASLSRAWERLPAFIGGCATDLDLKRELQVAAIDAGADGVPYIACATGCAGYLATNLEPSGHCFADGDLAYFDLGATVDGYYCDFNRHVAFGWVDDATRSAYQTVFHALEEGLAAAGPGGRLGEVWASMARILDRHGGAESGIGRLGHSIGLSITEPPSIARDADATLVPGMVLALEPSLAYPPRLDGAPRRLMVQEENIVITESGCDLISTPRPKRIPVI